MTSFNGTIIEESLEDKSVLSKVKIIKTKVEKVTERHQTPWIEQWTLDSVEIEEKYAEKIAEEISKVLDSKHNWYADFKNEKVHFVIFRNKVFKINRDDKKGYMEATKYGISIGIPDYQVDFSRFVKKWKR